MIPRAPTDPVALLRSLGEMSFVIDRQGLVREWWGTRAHLSSPSQPPVGRSLDGLFPADEASRLLGAIAASSDGTIRTFECALPDGDGARYFEARVAPATRGEVLVVLRDVHERRVIAERLRESEERFREMADHAPVLLWMAGTDANCTFFNRVWLEFTGRTLAQELGVGWAEGVHPEDFTRCMDIYLTAFVQRARFRMEYRLRRHDGEFRWLLDQGTPRLRPDGTFEGFIGSCVDITEMKDADGRVRSANRELARRVELQSATLREREVLLQEVHHRVKNNLQLVSSLLNLQSREVEGGPAHAPIRDARDRVLSIALVHEKLYESGNLSRVPFRMYATDVVRAIAHAVGRPNIVVDVTGDIDLSVGCAVPCGLILNELVTNAYKYAFPDCAPGTIRVALAPAEAGRLMLSVVDDGVGLPEEIDLARPSTLGLDLVANLVVQLGADLHVERGRGTAIHIRFDANEVRG